MIQRIWGKEFQVPVKFFIKRYIGLCRGKTSKEASKNTQRWNDCKRGESIGQDLDVHESIEGREGKRTKGSSHQPAALMYVSTALSFGSGCLWKHSTSLAQTWAVRAATTQPRSVWWYLGGVSLGSMRWCGESLWHLCVSLWHLCVSPSEIFVVSPYEIYRKFLWDLCGESLWYLCGEKQAGTATIIPALYPGFQKVNLSLVTT